MSRARLLLAAACLALLAAPALGDDEKKPGDADPFADLFGDSLGKKEDLDGLRDAARDIKSERSAAGLKPKAAAIDADAKIELKRVFAAERIRMHPRRGCEPADRERTRLVEMTFNTFPIKGAPFSVCLTLASASGREMRMTTSIVDPRNKRLGRAESVVSFRGKPLVDHIMRFPALRFERPGAYAYVVEIEGKEVGRLKLFDVKLDPDA